MPQERPSRAVGYALAAAGLFGVSTSLAKGLLGGTPPMRLAGLLYAGSGLGLKLWDRLMRTERCPLLPGRGWSWLLGAVASGGVIAPVCLMAGLADHPGLHVGAVAESGERPHDAHGVVCPSPFFCSDESTAW
jgi:drug/metabolite transporter (DMT)-like permease